MPSLSVNIGDVLGPLGALTLALFIVISFMNGWIVSRRTYDDMRRDRDDWRDVATTTTTAAETAVRAATVSRRVRVRRDRVGREGADERD